MGQQCIIYKYQQYIISKTKPTIEGGIKLHFKGYSVASAKHLFLSTLVGYRQSSAKYKEIDSNTQVVDQNIHHQARDTANNKLAILHITHDKRY